MTAIPNRILHVHAALAMTTPTPRILPVSVEIAGQAFWSFRGYNVYLDSVALVIRFKAEDADSYFAEVEPGVIAYIGRVSQTWCDETGNVRGSDAGMRARLLAVAEWGSNTGQTALETLPAFLVNYREILADMEGYTARGRAAIALKRRENEIEREAEMERQRLRAEADAAAAIERDTLTWSKGGYISWDGFEVLCERHNVVMHIRTIGTGRKRITEVSRTSLRGSGGAVGAHMWDAVRELGRAIPVSDTKLALVESRKEVAA
jgi:hypothetical protein